MVTEELLQKYFGISYDQYKKLSSKAKTDLNAQLTKKINADSSLTDEQKTAYLTEGLNDLGENYNGLKKFTDTIGVTDYKGEQEAVNNAKDAVTAAGEKASATYDDIIATLGGTDAIKSYVETLGKANDTITNTDFSYNKTVDQFMDPAAEYTINQSVKAAQNALAGQGGMSGGAAAQQLQAVASEAASSEYNNAWDRMLKDQQIETDTKKAEIEKANTVLGNVKDLSEDTINAILAQMGTDLNLQQLLAQINIDNAGSSFWGDALNAIKDGSEAYSNFKS